jgi:hypothetical protein
MAEAEIKLGTLSAAVAEKVKDAMALPAFFILRQPFCR